MNNAPDDNIIRTIIFETILKNNNKNEQIPNKIDENRYYKCELDLNALNCKKINEPIIKLFNKDIYSVKSYIPEMFDKTIIKYKLIMKNVIIENNQLKTK